MREQRRINVAQTQTVGARKPLAQWCPLNH